MDALGIAINLSLKTRAPEGKSKNQIRAISDLKLLPVVYCRYLSDLRRNK